MKRIHSNENTEAKCQVCGNMYDKTDLNNHMKIHSDEKPFRCDFCEKTFRRRRDVRLHVERMD